jgi:hypothetical protein
MLPGRFIHFLMKDYRAAMKTVPQAKLEKS